MVVSEQSHQKLVDARGFARRQDRTNFAVVAVKLRLGEPYRVIWLAVHAEPENQAWLGSVEAGSQTISLKK